MAPPKATMTSASTPKKQCSKSLVVLVEENIPGVSSSEIRFPRDYIPPRKDTTNPINLLKDAKYELVEPEIPLGVIMEEDMLGLILNLKYAGHDIMDERKFLELALSNYLKSYLSAKNNMVVIEP